MVLIVTGFPVRIKILIKLCRDKLGWINSNHDVADPDVYRVLLAIGPPLLATEKTVGLIFFELFRTNIPKCS